MLTAIVRRARRATRGERSDAGITLMELVVSMGLMTLLSSMAVVFFVTMNTASTRTIDSNVSTSSARNTLESWVAELRLADSHVTAGSSAGRFDIVKPTEVLFYANINNRSCTTCAAPLTRIDLSIQGSTLVEKDYVYDGSGYPASPTNTRHLAIDVSTNGTLFTPYVVGNPPTAVRLNLCPNGAAGICTGTTGADSVLDTIVRIDIRFSVKPSDRDPAQTFSSSASITGSTS